MSLDVKHPPSIPTNSLHVAPHSHYKYIASEHNSTTDYAPFRKIIMDAVKLHMNVIFRRQDCYINAETGVT